MTQFETSFHMPLHPTLHYPLVGKVLFDCRFYGAVEMVVRSRYRQLLSMVEIAARATATDPAWKEAWAAVHSAFPALGGLLNYIERLSREMVAHPAPAARQALRRALCDSQTMLAADVCGSMADARWQDTVDHRRVGIGDQIVLLDLIQKAARQLGSGNCAIVYDPIYPGSQQLFKAAGLLAIAQSGQSQIDVERLPLRGGTWSIVPMRTHPLEHAISGPYDPIIGEMGGYPGVQIAHDVGWLPFIEPLPLQVSLSPAQNDVANALALTAGLARYVTCNPIEITRQNRVVTFDAWKHIIRERNPHRFPVLIGCSRDEQPLAFQLVRTLGTEQPSHVVTASLGIWLAVISRSRRHFTGNCGGMWLGLSREQTPLTIASASTRDHGTMWEPKATWFSAERVKNVELLSL